MAELLGQDADEWIALVGRIPDDVTEIIKNEPQAMPELLRAAKGLTAEQLRKLAEQIRNQRKEGGKEE
jgi:hypothetical protein